MHARSNKSLDLCAIVNGSNTILMEGHQEFIHVFGFSLKLTDSNNRSMERIPSIP